MKFKKSTKVRVTRTGRRLFFALAVLFSFGFGLCLTSCNVTRKITTESQYVQRGDTSVVIQTKTIESYDATKQLY